MKLPRCSSLTEASVFSHLACLNRQTTSQKQPRGVHVSNLRVTYETVRCLLFGICLDMLAMVVSESSFGAYVCLTRPAGLHRDERSRRCIRLQQQSDRTETFENDATVRRIVTTFVWPQTQFHENLQTCKILLCTTSLQTSFAWSWVAS